MTELLEEKLIIKMCLSGELDNADGGYCTEPTRTVARKLMDKGLITYTEVEGKLHHLKNFRLTQKGREKYLDANDNLRTNYVIKDSDY